MKLSNSQERERVREAAKERQIPVNTIAICNCKYFYRCWKTQRWSYYLFADTLTDDAVPLCYILLCLLREDGTRGWRYVPYI